MPDIQILSPHLADLIAAGEVVERPASVVKELVENAFDAGARTVTVELRGGGATYLRVTDDGCGMAPEDAGIAFLRHATSKLHDEQGLEAIGTMGFRGEALAAISAVSHITLTTRQRGARSAGRLIGEAMHTYILVEKGETLILIDKHAAHERINFDRLRQSPADIPSQTLLEPLPFTPDASDADVLQQYGNVLAELGFTLEPFGRNDYILRGVPAQLDAADALPALEEICAQLRHGAHMDAQSVRDEVLKTVACKAAIKAGWQTEPEELLRLADAVCAGEVKYCPHGRPVAVTLTRRELDKLFKRIV